MNSIPSISQIARFGVKTKKIDGEIVMCCGEQPFRGNIYTFDPYEHRPWQECVTNMYADGVRIFSYICPLVLGWDIEEQYDFSLLDKLHDEIIGLAPQALLIPRVFLTTPAWWDKKYPEELLRFKNDSPRIKRWGNESQKLWKYEAKMYHDTQNASLASAQWKEDAGNALKAFITHSMNKYPGHFIVFHLAYGTCGEWGTFGTYKNGRFGCYDFSKPMQETFRTFLRNKYSSENALRSAWNTPELSFESAQPPDKLTLLKTDYFTLKNPRLHQHCADWFEHYSSTRSSAIAYFCATVKNTSPKPVLTCVLGGGEMQVGASAYQIHFAGESLKILMALTELDIISTPNWYENRKLGIASQAPVAGISVNKLFIAECDVRTMTGKEDGFTMDAPTTRKEGFSNFCRDTFFNMTQGQGLLWWYDFGNGWFRDHEIRTTIRKLNSLNSRTMLVNEQAEIAVVIDGKTNSYTEGNCGYFRQFRKFINHLLPCSGSAFDVITFDDMFKPSPYKLYIFRDLFYCSSVMRNQIREFVKKNRASCLWFYAAGTINENGIDTADSYSLTNIKVKTHNTITTSAVTLNAKRHPLCSGLELPLAFSETNDIETISAPVFFVNDAQTEVLGQLESLESPGIACKYEAGRFDLWSASALLPSKLCANIARAAGCRQQSPVGVMTFGSGNMRMFLSSVDVKVRIDWNSTVTALCDVISGQTYFRKEDHFDIQLSAGMPVLLQQKT